MRKKLVSLVILVPMLAGIASAELIGYWPLDEGQGTAVLDMSGNGNDGTIVGAPTWVGGQMGKAMSFNGSSDYVNLGQKDAFNPTGSFSLSFWVNIGSWDGNWGNVMISNRGESGIGWQVRKNGSYGSTGNSNGLSFTTRGVGFDDFATTDVPPTNTWMHVTCVYDNIANTKAIYINGVLDRSEVVNAGTIAPTTTLTLMGARDNGSGGVDSFFTGILDEVRMYNGALTAEDAQQLAALVVASLPTPNDGATDVRPDSVLTWKAGENAVAHNVYLGTNAVDIAAAEADSDLLVAAAQAEATYAPGNLAIATTYYWRVDEIDDNGEIAMGSVWSLETEPLAYPVTPVAATATTTSDEGKGPGNLINGVGLTDGVQDTNDLHMWLGEPVDGNAPAVQFDFDALYKFNDVHVWNYNITAESLLGFGVKDMTIEYSVDGEEWMTLGDVTLPQATPPAAGPYTGSAVALDGIVAKYIKFSIISNFTGRNNYGLSEVAFSYIPVLAREPEPADGSSDVAANTVLAWRPGREAASHVLSLGTDPNAVAAGQDVMVTTEAPTYDATALGLLLGQEYFWMITEVNDAETPQSWDSAVWSFETPEYIVVDDMEGYDDEDNRIYNSWIDGLDDAANGSQVAPDDPPYAETAIVHSGSQSMRMQYGIGGAAMSQAVLTLGEPIDLTLGGPQTLVVWFRGKLGNATPQLYAAINGGANVNYTGSAASLAAPVWKQWNIDLAGAGSSLTSVTLGVSGVGEGEVYIDDIRLYREAAPQTGSGVDPGMDNLMAYYPMSGSVADATGNGYDGTTDTGTFGDGPTGYGQALVIDTADANSYANLEIGSLIESLSDSTITMWVNWAGEGSQWCRIFDFGTSTSNYIFLTPYGGSSDLRVAIRTNDVGEQIIARAGILSAGWHSVALTMDSAAKTMALYIDGEMVASGETQLMLQDLGNTNLNYLGKSQYSSDPLLPGSIDEFRIYDRVLSGEEILYLGGDQ